jgi:hypothetical protein
MANEKIEAWLASEEKDFTTGLNLFTEFSNNRSIYLYLSRKQNTAKLQYELEKLAGIPVIKPVPEIVQDEKPEGDSETTGTSTTGTQTPDDKGEGITDETVLQIVSGKKINPDTLPENMRKIYDVVIEAYKLQRSAHEKMKLATTDEQRAKLRKEVVRLDDIIGKGWDALEEGQKAKTDPPADGNTDPLSIMKEVNAARTFVSRNLQKVQTLEGTKRETLIAKLRERYLSLVNLKADIDPETKQELQKLGIT